MIVGIGVDAVDIDDLERRIERTPALRDRLFAPIEQGLSPASTAARFAAKEALIKALGGIGQLRFVDMAVARQQGKAPKFAETDALQQVLAERGVSKVHVSLTHEKRLAIAYVVLEGEDV